jgi:undecaprenyl-diphosphatase
MQYSITLNRHLRWAETNKAVPITIGVSLLLGLGVFAYFASVVNNFPGEVSFSTWVQSWREPWLDSLMKAVGVLGTVGVAGAIVVSTSVVLYLKGWRTESLLVLAAPIAGRLLIVTLKNIVERPRPSDGLVQVLQQADSYAFPSGQVTHYAVFLGTLLFVTWISMRPTIAVRLFQGALVLTMAVVGLARIYLGAHWLGDVVAGYAFGAALAAVLALSWWRLMGRRRASPALHS